MRILTIDNPKGFVKSDLTQVNKILNGSEFRAKRLSKTKLEVRCTRSVILSTDGMFDFVHELLSENFKAVNQ